MASSTDFLPSREAKLVEWSSNFSEKLSLAPGTYGVTPAQAAAYAALHADFAAIHQAVNQPTTRTPASIIAKDGIMRALKDDARLLARIIRATPTVTDAQRGTLGLTIRRDGVSPVPAPASPPDLSIVAVIGRTVKLRLRDKDGPTRRGKPVGVAGAIVLLHVGDHPPADPMQWSFAGAMTHATFDIQCPAAVPPGERVWITAMWYSAKGQTSAPATPRSTRVADGVAMSALKAA